MALPSTYPRDTGLSKTTGIVMSITPSDPIFGIEVQRALEDGSTGLPDAATAVTIDELPPAPLTGVIYTDELPLDNAKRFYRARHVRSGYTASAYTNWTAPGRVPISLGYDPKDEPAPLSVRVPPGLRRVVARCLRKQPGERYQGAGEIASALERTAADVAIVGVASTDWVGLSGLLRELLARHPRLTVVALASDGRSGYVYQQQPRGVAINDISPKSLLHAIRSTAATDVHPPIHPFSAE